MIYRHLRPCSILAVLSVLVVQTGCGSSDAELPPLGRSVQCFSGQPLDVPVRPIRVVPTTSAAASWALALVGPERLAGLPEQAFDYSFSGAELDPAEWEGRMFGHFSAERVLELEPDLVIMGSLQSPEAAVLLRRSGVGVVALPDLSEFDGLLSAVETLGWILAAEPEAEALFAELTSRREALRTRLPAGAEQRVLTYSNLGTGGWTAGGGSTAQLFIELSGHRCLAAEAGLEGYPPLDIERLLELDPDVLVIGASVTDSEHSPTASYLRSEPALATCRAVREERIVVLPASLFSAGSHHIVDAAEHLARAIEGL